jgi:hypothetical protein
MAFLVMANWVFAAIKTSELLTAGPTVVVNLKFGRNAALWFHAWHTANGLEPLWSTVGLLFSIIV